MRLEERLQLADSHCHAQAGAASSCSNEYWTAEDFVWLMSLAKRADDSCQLLTTLKSQWKHLGTCISDLRSARSILDMEAYCNVLQACVGPNQVRLLRTLDLSNSPMKLIC